MNHAIPTAYTSYRFGWSVLHISLISALLVLALIWFVRDGQGERAVSKCLGGLVEMQQEFARLLPFPWES